MKKILIKNVCEIDQSGKIEQTNLDTIIALSNGLRYTVILPKKDKRILQDIFRKERRPRMFIYDVFSALLTILLIKTKASGKIFLDKEYLNEGLIKARILEFLKMANNNYVPDIEFTLVGKLSPAHILAAKVANKKLNCNLVVTLEEISKILWPQKKTGYSAINRTEGNLSQDWLPVGRKPSRSLTKKYYHVKAKKSI